MMAERESSTLETWQDLHASYKKYKQCDDGAIGEGYSNSVGTLLSDGWNELPRLLSLSKADPGFGEFVLRHVDQTIPAATLQTISENARSRCPTDAASTCARIISAVQETLAPQ